MPCTLHGQNDFAKAQDTITRFWTDASQWGRSSDPQELEDRHQRAIALPELVQGQLTSGIIAYLNETPDSSAEALKAKLARALTPPTLGNQTIDNAVDVIVANSGDSVYVAYDVTYCASCSRSWLGEFSRGGGVFHLQAVSRSPSQDTSVHLALLGSSSSNPVLVLYGLHWGDPHNRSEVKVFSMDGKLQELWSKSELWQGNVSIDGDELKLVFLSDFTSDAQEITETYELRSNQLIETNRAIGPSRK
jgi:hypothetical protein